MRAKGDILQIWGNFVRHLRAGSVSYVLLAFVLIPVNYGLEALKWQRLTAPFVQLSFGDALRGVLLGAGFGVLTPARLGDYGGRLYAIPRRFYPRVVWALTYGSAWQTAILLGMGTWGMYQLWDVLPVNVTTRSGFLLLLWLIHFLFVGILVTHGLWLGFVKRKFGKRLRIARDAFVVYDLRQMVQIAVLSLLRVGAFSLQYYLLNVFFGLDAGAVTDWAIVSVIFLFQSIVLVPNMLGLLMKSQIGLWLWGEFGGNVISVISGTFFLWLFNTVVPALAGLALAGRFFKDKLEDHV